MTRNGVAPGIGYTPDTSTPRTRGAPAVNRVVPTSTPSSRTRTSRASGTRRTSRLAMDDSSNSEFSERSGRPPASSVSSITRPRSSSSSRGVPLGSQRGYGFGYGTPVVWTRGVSATWDLRVPREQREGWSAGIPARSTNSGSSGTPAAAAAPTRSFTFSGVPGLRTGTDAVSSGSRAPAPPARSITGRSGTPAAAAAAPT
ncbi:unnamed protein product, partial [Laminaria digitata]